MNFTLKNAEVYVQIFWLTKIDLTTVFYLTSLGILYTQKEKIIKVFKVTKIFNI